MKNIIEIKNASYNYKGSDDEETVGVTEINLAIKQGEFVTLLGHNGSGKSTLAKLLNGFLLPQEGDVIINGINTKEKERVFDIRSKVGMVFQNPDNQMVASIIEDDIAFGAEDLGIERQEIIERVDWALTAVGMQEYRKHTPFKLSGGQKQRIAIAAILAMRPTILILDESTAMLDPKGRREVLEVIKKLNLEQNITVILITHFMEEAIDSDKVYVMNEGRVISSGTPREVFARKEIINVANLDLPIASQLSQKLREDGYHIDFSLTADEVVEEICQLL